MFYLYKRGKQLFSERECNAVLRLVKKDRRFNLCDIINQFNEERDRTFSCRAIHLHVMKNRSSRCVVKKKMVDRSENKKKKRVVWRP